VESPFHIVLVEDNPADVRLLQELLLDTKTGDITMTVCQDGDEAIECVFRRGSYKTLPEADLVLLDLNLPRRNGYDVLRELKNNAGTRSVPVLILSSSGAPSDIRRAYDMHANSYIQKPATLEGAEQIARVIREFWLSCAALPYRAAP
jgi:CheY-like chemotaxis protein